MLKILQRAPEEDICANEENEIFADLENLYADLDDLLKINFVFKIYTHREKDISSFLFYFAKALYLCGFADLKKFLKKSFKKNSFLFYLAYYMCQQRDVDIGFNF